MTGVIATPGETSKILKKYGLKLSRRLGQNFLIDRNIINKIVEAGDIFPDDLVIEIGPGIGSLTQALLERLNNGKLIAIEKDKRLVVVLSEIFGGKNNIEIIDDDVLDINFSKFKDLDRYKSIKIMANLPYYITTPIIMKLLESGVKFNKMVFMVQKEVGERIVAAPGGKDYGGLSVAVQYYCNPQITFKVPPTVFIPRPEVDSAVISLLPYSTPPFEVQNKEFYFKIVRGIFQQRRKTLQNSLSKAVEVDIEKNMIRKALEKMDLDQRIRGEKLSPAELARLSNILWEMILKGREY